jgi:hypothetical protein
MLVDGELELLLGAVHPERHAEDCIEESFGFHAGSPQGGIELRQGPAPLAPGALPRLDRGVVDAPCAAQLEVPLERPERPKPEHPLGIAEGLEEIPVLERVQRVVVDEYLERTLGRKEVGNVIEGVLDSS